MSLGITSFFIYKAGKSLYFYTDKLQKDYEAAQKILYSFSSESESETLVDLRDFGNMFLNIKLIR